jgi:hypothetical protein
MALFNVNLDKLSGQFEAASKRDAALAAMKEWKRGGAFSVQKVEKEKSPTIARKNYKCECCGGEIKKGEGYFPEARSIGTPGKQSFDGIAVIEHGIRYTAQICTSCK